MFYNVSVSVLSGEEAVYISTLCSPINAIPIPIIKSSALTSLREDIALAFVEYRFWLTLYNRARLLFGIIFKVPSNVPSLKFKLKMRQFVQHVLSHETLCTVAVLITYSLWNDIDMFMLDRLIIVSLITVRKSNEAFLQFKWSYTDTLYSKQFTVDKFCSTVLPIFKLCNYVFVVSSNPHVFT